MLVLHYYTILGQNPWRFAVKCSWECSLMIMHCVVLWLQCLIGLQILHHTRRSQGRIHLWPLTLKSSRIKVVMDWCDGQIFLQCWSLFFLFPFLSEFITWASIWKHEFLRRHCNFCTCLHALFICKYYIQRTSKWLNQVLIQDGSNYVMRC